MIYYNIPFIHNFWKEHGSCVFILDKTKLCGNYTLELILFFWTAFISILYTEHFGQTFQFLISSFLCIMPRSSQAHQSCYLNGWQIEYHSDHATLGILIYRVQGKNAEYKLFRNLLYQHVFPEHPPVAEQRDYFSLLIVLISYLPHWKQRVIRETKCIKQQTNLASKVHCIEVNNLFSQSNLNAMPRNHLIPFTTYFCSSCLWMGQILRARYRTECPKRISTISVIFWMPFWHCLSRYKGPR